MATHLEVVISIEALGFTHRIVDVAVPNEGSFFVNWLTKRPQDMNCFTAKVDFEEVEDAVASPEPVAPVVEPPAPLTAEPAVVEPAPAPVQAVDAWGNPVVTS